MNKLTEDRTIKEVQYIKNKQKIDNRVLPVFKKCDEIRATIFAWIHRQKI